MRRILAILHLRVLSHISEAVSSTGNPISTAWEEQAGTKHPGIVSLALSSLRQLIQHTFSIEGPSSLTAAANRVFSCSSMSPMGQIFSTPDFYLLSVDLNISWKGRLTPSWTLTEK